MKPTLFLNVGTGWSGTTPLYYTLGWKNKYCHSGHRKEKGYLWLLQLQEQKRIVERVKFYKKFFGPSRKSTTNRKPRIFTHESQYVKGLWTDEEIKKFWSAPFTIKKYIDYNLKNWDNIKHDYKATADFSNPNGFCCSGLLEEIAPELKKHFDVKVHFVFRDPIARLWSMRQKQKPDDPLSHFLRSGVDFDYVDMYGNWEVAFGRDNIHITIMEDFWNGHTKPLSDFIGFPIGKIYPNAYVPDMGSKAPHIEYLNDQWESDVMDMTPEIMVEAKRMMEPVYMNFKNYFGKLPSRWVFNS